jgi:RNA polymerase-binding transcription factor DksA
MSDLNKLRQELEKQQKALEEKLSRIEADKRASHSQDFADQAQERENDEVVDALAIELEKKLADVGLALTRIDKQLYGTCFLCGKPIDPARLHAKPEAVSCITCV